MDFNQTFKLNHIINLLEGLLQRNSPVLIGIDKEVQIVTYVNSLKEENPLVEYYIEQLDRLYCQLSSALEYNVELVKDSINYVQAIMKQLSEVIASLKTSDINSCSTMTSTPVNNQHDRRSRSKARRVQKSCKKRLYKSRTSV